MSLNDWPLQDLKSITTKIGSGATPRGGKESYKDKGISLIRSLNVYDFYFDKQDLAFIDERQALGLQNVEVEASDVLLNITGASVARCCMVPKNTLPARVNQHVSIVRVNPDLAIPKFVQYILTSSRYKRHLLSLAQSGATREALTKEKIENFRIPIPPLPVQRKIAAVLSAYDDLIENNTRRIEILEEMAQIIYREWFVEFRFPGHEDVEMVDSELGSIPEGWEVKKFSDIFEINYGKNLPLREVFDQGEYPVYGANGIVGYYDDFVSDEKVALVSCRGAKSGKVLRTREPAFITNNSLLLTPNKQYEYMQYFFIELFLKYSNIKTIVSGSAQPQVTISGLQPLKSIVPLEKTINQFSEIVETIPELIDLIYRKNRLLRQTRDLLLPKLVSGEVDVSELEIAV